MIGFKRAYETPPTPKRDVPETNTRPNCYAIRACHLALLFAAKRTCRPLAWRFKWPTK